MNNKLILESQIQQLIYNDNKCTTHFKYESNNSKMFLEIITINPSHDTQFLLGQFSGNTEIECLNNALQIIQNKNKDSSSNSYTVNWYKVDENKTLTSYFYAKTIEDLMKKFNYGKTSNDYIIYFIKLNPIS